MAEVLLFHHAPGQTVCADELRDADQTVHTPDRYAGCTFGTNAAIPQDPRPEAPDRGRVAPPPAPIRAGSRAGDEQSQPTRRDMSA